MSDQSELGSKGFADPTRALRMRDAIRKIAEEEIGKLTANQQVGRVISANFSNMTAKVWIPGDPEPINVSLFEDLIPGAIGKEDGNGSAENDSIRGIGSLVIVDKIAGTLYVTRVLSGGQFAHNLGAAGFVHKSMNALHTAASDAHPSWRNSPPVSGNYGLEISLFGPSNGQACMIGPFVANGDGTFYPGYLKIIVTRWEDTAVFEAVVDDSQIWRGSSVGETRWMRLIPQMGGSDWDGQSMAMEIGLRTTSYRDKQGYNEIWLRIIDSTNDADFFHIHVEAYGPLVTYGDVNTGRIRIEDEDDPLPFSGYLGFHDSYFLFRGRHEEAGKTGPFHYGEGSDVFDGPTLHSGSWHMGPRVMHQQIQRTWGCDGYMTWNGSRVKWSGNLVFGTIGRSMMTLPDGKLEVPVPASGVIVPIVPPYPGGQSADFYVTTDANGIPLTAGQTLYYGIPPGMANGSSVDPGFSNIDVNQAVTWHNKTWMFFIVPEDVHMEEHNTFYVPEWAIPICGRKASNWLNEFQVYSHNCEVVDTTKFQVASSTSSTGNLAIDTEHVVQSITNFNFKAGAAYRVTAKSGWIINNPATVNTTAANNTVINFRLRKGATAGGADIGEFFRLPVTSALGAVHHFYSEIYIAPSVGGSNGLVLTAALDWGAGANPANTPTMIMYAGASRRWLEIEYAGPAARFPQATPY